MDPTHDTRYKLLIVDDVAKNIQVAANILQQGAYQIAFAQDGPTAIQQSDTNRFDLILLDIMMPDMDGFEVCRRIKENPANREIPVIFLTAKNDADSVVQGFELGAMDYLTKPFNGAELQARVKTHLELYRSKQELRAANERLSIEIAQRENAEEELRRGREEYRQLAIHDGLTGLYNTRHLYGAVEQLVADGRRQGSQFSIIFLDIDNFKHVVDTHGHLNGSQALAEVAQTIMGCIAAPAFGVAYGGDEFVVVLPGCDHHQAMQKAQEIRSRMLSTRYLPAIHDGVHLQASFGVSTYPEDAADIKAMLAKADKAMFQIKTKGKNAVGDGRGITA
jgi:diguanylate cyclase (GGDEF)-like protein